MCMHWSHKIILFIFKYIYITEWEEKGEKGGGERGCLCTKAAKITIMISIVFRDYKSIFNCISCIVARACTFLFLFLWFVINDFIGNVCCFWKCYLLLLSLILVGFPLFNTWQYPMTASMLQYKLELTGLFTAQNDRNSIIYYYHSIQWNEVNARHINSLGHLIMLSLIILIFIFISFQQNLLAKLFNGHFVSNKWWWKSFPWNFS